MNNDYLDTLRYQAQCDQMAGRANVFGSYLGGLGGMLGNSFNSQRAARDAQRQAMSQSQATPSTNKEVIKEADYKVVDKEQKLIE